MKKNLVLASLLVASSAAFAQTNNGALSNVYTELGYHSVKLETEGLSTKPGIVSGLIGYQFHPNLSTELFLATGAGDDDDRFGGIRVNTKIKNSYGVFLRPSAMVANKLELFGRLGYLKTKIRASAAGFSASDSDDSFAYGVGANYYFSKQVYGQVSYTSFYDKHGDEAKGFGASVGYHF